MRAIMHAMEYECKSNMQPAVFCENQKCNRLHSVDIKIAGGCIFENYLYACAESLQHNNNPTLWRLT